MSQALEVDRGALPEPVAKRSSVSPRWSMLVGLCGLFAIWVLVLPPFAGSDEHDHAYRAAAAARGQWAIDPVNATRGTGAWLDVPADIVKAARPECQALAYTRDRDCVGTPAGGNTIRVASGAGRYHPLFYAVIGTVAKPFDGATALYAMRFATALLAAAFVWMAARAAATWARTRWPFLGIAVACTPVAIYSCAVASPNGVEMMSALALWLSLVGLLVAPPEHIRRLAAYAGISGAVLATLRPLGPLWCLMIFAVVLVAVRTDPGRIKALVRRPAVLLGALLVLVSAAQSTAWVFAMDALKLGVEGSDHTSLGYRLHISATQLPAWIFQAIAAFPLRNQPTHPAVYACYLVLFLTVLVLGLRFGSARSRAGILLVMASVLAFPYLTTVQSFDKYSTAWQGRYGLAVAVGMVVLAAYVLDRRGYAVHGPLQLLLFLMFVVPQALSPAWTLRRETGASPQVDSSSWVQPSMLLTIVVAAASAALMWWGASGQHLPTKERASAEA
jgi:hypothetical protein